MIWHTGKLTDWSHSSFPSTPFQYLQHAGYCWLRRTSKRLTTSRIMERSAPMNAHTTHTRRPVRKNPCPKANASITFCIAAVQTPKHKWWTMRFHCPNSYQIISSATLTTKRFIPNCLSPIASKPTTPPKPLAQCWRRTTSTTRQRYEKESMFVRIFWNACDRINAFTLSWHLLCLSSCCIWSTFHRPTGGRPFTWLWRCCFAVLRCSLCSWRRCGIQSNGMAFCRAN